MTNNKNESQLAQNVEIGKWNHLFHQDFLNVTKNPWEESQDFIHTADSERKDISWRPDLVILGLDILAIILLLVLICKSCTPCRALKEKLLPQRHCDIEEQNLVLDSERESVSRTESEDPELYKKELERRKALYQADWSKANIYGDWRKEYFQEVHVTLDPDTAHPEVVLSEECRHVTLGKSPQNFLDNTNRFDTLPSVLGKQKITSGRHYWEVEVGSRDDWDLGVCREDVKKKGVVIVSPENGFWALRLYNDEYLALTSPPTFLSLRQSPHKMAIFLNYDEGDVSFYNMNDGSHIYNFTSVSFYGALCPFIRLWSCDQAPVTLCLEP